MLRSPSFLAVAAAISVAGCGMPRLAPLKLESVWYARGESSTQSFLAHADHISIVSPQVFSLDSNGVITGAMDPRMVAAAHEHHVKLVPLVMNPGFDQPSIHRVLTNPGARATALHNLASLCRDQHLDGIQFDIENVHVRDKDALTAFVRTSVDSVHHAGCTLSAAVVPRTSDDPGPTSYHKWIYDNWRAVYDYKALADTLDFISYMTYAQHTGGSPDGPVGGFPWIEQSLRFVLSLGVSPSKISLGIPGYSDWWYPAYDSIHGSRMRGDDISYERAREILAKSGITPDWDDVQKALHASWNEHDVFQHIWIEDRRAFLAKLGLVTKYHLRGYSVWVLGAEEPRHLERVTMIAPLLSLLAAATFAASDTTSYVVLNHGRWAGDLTIVHAGDSTVSRWIFTDRNRGTRIESRYRFGTDNTLRAAELRQIGADGTAGPAVQGFTVHGDSIYNISGGGRAGGAGASGGPTAAAPAGAKRDPAVFLGLRFGGPYEQTLIANYLLKQPKMTGKLLGGVAARAEVVAETTVPTKAGRTHVRLAMIWTGTATTSNGVWLDDKGNLVATDVQWFITVRPGAESALPALRAIEIKWRNAQAEALAKKVVAPAATAVVVKNGNLFDSESGTMKPNMTVVIRDGRITDVGPAASVQSPAGANAIDATGKTVMPGMWEMHTHLQTDNQSAGSLVQLAQGLTTVRDMAADFDIATSQRDRERKGLLASPRVILSGFIEGPGRWAGPSDMIATTEAEALAMIAKYDSAGYKQIKLYNLVQQDLVPAIAAEAHKRGLRLSGHIPRGLSVPAAVTLGYDEIQHAAFLFSTFYQDSLYIPTMRAYSLVATVVAPHIDVDGQPMTDLIKFLHDHHTVIDGTFSIWIGGGAAAVGAGGSTDQQKADAAYLRLITRLYEGGVTLVPGTDNSYATSYHREIELYEQAGIPAPTVLQIATIGCARVMHDDKDYGSIATGKVGDVIIVNGNPAEHVKEIEKVETVIRAGRVYKVHDLLSAVSGQP